MLRLGRGVKVQFEKIGSRGILLFPEGIVELNDSAFAILSRLPQRRQDLEEDLCKQYNTTKPIEGFDEFLQMAMRLKWIQEKKNDNRII